jgi:hypothetical protein
MPRHKRFRHGPPLFGPRRHFGGIFWLIGLAILFSSGHWWPGILVLIGLSMVFGSFFGEEKPSELQNQPPPYYEAPVMPPAPAPVEQIHRVDLLPLTCTHCGGPIRSHEVTWTSAHSAACPYCGSNLQMKKP